MASQIGVCSYTVRDFMTNKTSFRDCLKRLQELGFEVWQGGKAACCDSISEMVDLLAEYGFKNITGSAGYDDLMSNLDKVIADAKAFGVQHINTPTLPLKNRVSAQGYEAYAKEMNEVGKKLRDNGLKLIYHNHAMEFANFPGGKNGMQILLDHTDPENFGFIMDTHWASAAGADPAEWVLKLEGRMDIIHFKDYAIDPNPEPKHIQDIGGVYKIFAEIGYGNINWKPIVENCRKIGVQYFVIEQDYWRGCPIEALAKSKKYMNDVLDIH
ncbi:Xylose isomerase-like TIM barrel [uncultured Clostridium sp.]|nr:Xylose isomerase-like TIM barrel [uncultured Clostridium sp.]